jgi:hypothetical protein
MRKIEQLRAQRLRFEQEISNLRACLQNFERPINILLVKEGRTLSDLSMQECIQITNLLLEMYEEVEADELAEKRKDEL